MKIKDYVLYWYKIYRMPRQERTTQQTYLSAINNHIVGSELGEMEINEVETRHIQEFLTEELLHGKKTTLKHKSYIGEPLTPHTIIKLRQILVAAFKQAIKEGYISHNVAEDTETVSVPWKDVPVFTSENQRKFLAKTRHHRFHTAYTLLFFLGCRRSELLGLSWDAIDLRRNVLQIRQVLVMEDGKPVIRQRTKTKASLRTIPFPTEIRAMLQDWREKQRKESEAEGYNNEYNLVFCNKDGSPHNPTYFSRNFKNTVKRLGFLPKELHVHSARHTWATNAMQCGIAITDAQYLGGWSKPDTLLNVYAHTVKDSQRKAMKKLFKEFQ